MSASQQDRMPIILLKEGATETKGKDARKNNIAAAKLIAQVIRSSLGPRGMDKMLVDPTGDVTITNDGATILKEIEIEPIQTDKDKQQLSKGVAILKRKYRKLKPQTNLF